jgi:ABC-2 type transport system ATP-binding protein
VTGEPLIVARGLTRVFRRSLKQEGFRGTLRQLFRPHYQEVVAVDAVDFTIRRGEAVGYVGANGAGKSTTIKMLSGILVPTGGELQVAGLVPWKRRVEYVRHIGVVFGQRTQLWADLSVIDSYRVLKEMYGVSDADFRSRLAEYGEVLELEPLLPVQVRKLSLGQRMRVDLGAAFLHRPQIVFLDEPTIGLDFDVKERFRNFVNTMVAEEQTTVVLTTHDLRDIEDVCDRLIIIHEGKLICDDSLQSVKEQYARERMIVFSLGRSSPEELARRFASDEMEIEVTGEHEVTARFDRFLVNPARLVADVVSEFEVEDVAIREQRIEEVVKEIYRQRAQPVAARAS